MFKHVILQSLTEAFCGQTREHESNLMFALMKHVNNPNIQLQAETDNYWTDERSHSNSSSFKGH